MNGQVQSTSAQPGLAERYSSSAAEYARLWSPVIRPMGQRLIRALPLADAGRVLDIGTGTGAMVPDLQAAAPRALVVGVDGAAGMLRAARATVAAPLALMDARRLGFRPASFDGAVLIFILFHLPDPVQGLVEVARVLRPGGVLGVTTWGERPGFAASAVWDEALQACGAGPDPCEATDRDDLMDTPNKLAALLRQAGFGSVRAWTERFDIRWDAERLIAQRVGFGSYRRRLETLAPETRAACLARVRARLAEVEPDGFAYRPTIVFAVGRRPDGSRAGVPGDGGRRAP